MKDGFFRIMATAPETRIADVEYNERQIKAAIDVAFEKKAAMLILPELSITTASCRDLFSQSALLKRAEKAMLNIAEYTKHKNLIVVVGLPVTWNGAIYDAAAVILEGELLGIVPKRNFVGQGDRAQNTVFSPAPKCNDLIRIGEEEVLFGNEILFRAQGDCGICFGVEIGEDRTSPCSAGMKLAAAGAHLIVNPAAACEAISSENSRRNEACVLSSMGKCAYVYCSAGEGESTTSAVYSGQAVIAEAGYVLKEAAPYSEHAVLADIDLQLIAKRRAKQMGLFGVGAVDTVYFKIDTVEYDTILREYSTTPFVNSNVEKAKENVSCAMQIQAKGLAARIARAGIKKVVIGISGGLDSTMALLAAVKCFDMLDKDRKDIVTVTMPCFGTSKRTKTNAEKLCELLGTDLRVIDISDAVKLHLTQIGHDAETADVTYENAQARERTQVLMDISNMESGLVLGTGDLSEEALGWCTFNGDHISMYNVNCDLTKTFMRSCVYYYAESCGNDRLKAVLRDIVDTPVSPELKPAVNGEIAQKTEDILGPYEAHDFFIYHFIRNGYGPKKLLRVAEQAFGGIYTDEQLEVWLRKFFWKFFANQFKRNCSPDGPSVGSISLAPGEWKMVSDVSAEDFLRELD